CFDPDNPVVSPPSCTRQGPFGEPLLDPVIEYPNLQHGGIGLAVIGGYVYRGTALPELSGLYVFGDFSGTPDTAEGLVFVATPAASGLWPLARVDFPARPRSALGEYLKGFGEDR